MQRGFTLIELSIVLVIIGLLTGGILAGQSLIRSAEMRSIISQYQRYQVATHAFKDKYYAMPGDMKNAQTFWGVADPTPATCITTASTTATCNGDGDGAVEQTSAGSNEKFRFWQHLANAGMIEGSYSGVAGPLSAADNVSTNSPISRVAMGMWTAEYYGEVLSTDTALFEGKYDNTFLLGIDTTSSSGNADAPMIKPDEMWSIDAKIDDGKPAYGFLVSRENRALCVTTTTASTAEYLMTGTANGCALIFRNL